jgi:hypothetical protein
VGDNLSAPDFLAGFFDGGKEVNTFLDFMPSGNVGQILDGFHRQFLRGHARKVSDAGSGFKSAKNGISRRWAAAG